MRVMVCLGIAIHLLLSAGAHAGEALYNQQCAACHMPDGRGNAELNAPNITGMAPSYLARQLAHFKSGIRGGAPQDSHGQRMRSIASTLSNEAIVSVAEYIARLPFRPAALPKTDNTSDFVVLFEGRGLYSGCKSCHAADASGIEALGAPRLAGQYPSYLRRQIEHFKDGVRGTHDDDTHGRQMAMMATAIASDDSLDALLLYIHQLSDE